MDLEQHRLPLFDEIPSVSKVPRPRQPHLESLRSLSPIEIFTHPLDLIRAADPKVLSQASAARPMFEMLRSSMQEYFPDWNPEVVFRQELPPEEAFDF